MNFKKKNPQNFVIEINIIFLFCIVICSTDLDTLKKNQGNEELEWSLLLTMAVLAVGTPVWLWQ